jgi:hypothetical protein
MVLLSQKKKIRNKSYRKIKTSKKKYYKQKKKRRKTVRKKKRSKRFTLINKKYGGCPISISDFLKDEDEFNAVMKKIKDDLKSESESESNDTQILMKHIKNMIDRFSDGTIRVISFLSLVDEQHVNLLILEKTGASFDIYIFEPHLTETQGEGSPIHTLIMDCIKQLNETVIPLAARQLVWKGFTGGERSFYGLQTTEPLCDVWCQCFAFLLILNPEIEYQTLLTSFLGNINSNDIYNQFDVLYSKFNGLDSPLNNSFNTLLQSNTIFKILFGLHVYRTILDTKDTIPTNIIELKTIISRLLTQGRFPKLSSYLTSNNPPISKVITSLKEAFHTREDVVREETFFKNKEKIYNFGMYLTELIRKHSSVPLLPHILEEDIPSFKLAVDTAIGNTEGAVASSGGGGGTAAAGRAEGAGGGGGGGGGAAAAASLSDAGAGGGTQADIMWGQASPYTPPSVKCKILLETPSYELQMNNGITDIRARCKVWNRDGARLHKSAKIYRPESVRKAVGWLEPSSQFVSTGDGDINVFYKMLSKKLFKTQNYCNCIPEGAELNSTFKPGNSSHDMSRGKRIINAISKISNKVIIMDNSIKIGKLSISLIDTMFQMSFQQMITIVLPYMDSIIKNYHKVPDVEHPYCNMCSEKVEARKRGTKRKPD